MNRTPSPSEGNSRAKTSTTRHNKFFEKSVAVFAALLLWQVVSLLLGRQILLVSPIDVFIKLAEMSVTPDFWGSVAFSFSRIAGGFVIALMSGLALAALAARFHLVEVFLWPYMALVKATPVASFIILCLIFLNAANLSVFISFLMVLPIIYVNVLSGIRNADPKLLEMARVFRVRPLRKLMYIYLPAVRPFLASACTLAAGLSWKAGIAAEVIGIPDGSIGERLYEAKVYISTPELFAWTFVIIAISISFEKLLSILLSKIPHRRENV